MLTQSLIYLPGIIGVAGVGLFVVARSRQVSFRLFGIFSLSLVIWLTFQYLTDARVGSGRLWLTLASVALSFMAGTLLLFVYVYPDRHTLPKKWLFLGISPVFLFAPLSLIAPSLFISNVTYGIHGIDFKPGPLFTLQTYLLVGYMLASLIVLFTRLKSADINQRHQIYSLVAAFLVALVGNVLAGYVFLNSTYWQAARPVSIFLMIGIIAYSMIYHKLFDIRAYAVRAVAYSTTFASVALFYIAVSFFVTAHLLGTRLKIGTVVYLTAVTGLVAVLFQPIHAFFNRLTNRLFFREYYDPQDVLDRLSDLLARTIDLTRLQQACKQIIVEALNVNSLEYWLEEGEQASYPHIDALFEGSTGQGVVVVDALTDRHTIAEELRAKDIAVIVRLRTTHGNLGYMLLGFKKSGETYSQKDIRLLGTVADEIAISMQNALHFEEIQNFNKTLKDQINQATIELRKTNAKLKLLDETKDEFITMASHQLRTPLTSVKGYLSMVLEGDAGKLNSNQEKLLEQSYLSSQRMVYLISDLLNLSRLNTGKFVIEPSEVDLSEVAQVEVDQLAETAKARNLNLVYVRPTTFPKLMLDETKIHQVVMNFIDNAIYYTPSGGTVTVSLRETPAAVEYTVKDTGIGVPKAVQHKLFTKFYRAGNAQQARPDGTGLGLFMAKKVVAAQGGAIIFESEEGKGSTFGFRFNKVDHTVSGAAGKTDQAKRTKK